MRESVFSAPSKTVKLRGRTTTPDERRGRTPFLSARGVEPAAVHGPFQRLLGSTSLFRSPVGNVLEAYQSLRIRYHAMLHFKVPRCWKVCNDFCGGAGATFLNGRIR